MEAVGDQLGAKVEQAPDFFHNAPVVIDLQALNGSDGGVEFPLLVGLLRGYGMIPVGVRGGTKTQNEAAEAMELAILGDTVAKPPARARTTQKETARPSPTPSRGAAFKLVTRPIRSGQRVYAAGGDLVVVAQVSSGAEIMADGNIHVYGTLRGRALAGVKGNQEARIFCKNLQAELISVSGHYRISENIASTLKGKAVQIYLDERTLRVEEL
jgi:septum site-determining protein MinC